MKKKVLATILLSMMALSTASDAADRVSENECEAFVRYREVANFLFTWAVSKRAIPGLGYFPQAEEVQRATRIVVRCPFVASNDLAGLDSRFVSDGACGTWQHGDGSGKCIQLSLVIDEESRDNLKVGFTVTSGLMAAQGRYYSCTWENGVLSVELVPGVIILA